MIDGKTAVILDGEEAEALVDYVERLATRRQQVDAGRTGQRGWTVWESLRDTVRERRRESERDAD